MNVMTSARLAGFPTACLAILAATLGLTLPAARADGGEELLFDRVNLRLAGFFAEMSTEVRLDSLELGLGTVLNFEDDLDLDNSDAFLNLDFAFRLGRRHQLGVGFLDISRPAESVVITEIKFGDEVFPVDATVESFLDYRVLELSYTYWFLLKPRSALGIAFGLQQISIDMGIREQDFEIEEMRETELPVPLVGLDYRKVVAGKLVFRARGRIIDAEIEDWSGRILDITAELEHRTLRYLGFGLGVTAIDIRANVEDPFFRGALRFDYAGAQLFARLRY
jgi:hypothetical protein